MEQQVIDLFLLLLFVIVIAGVFTYILNDDEV